MDKEQHTSQAAMAGVLARVAARVRAAAKEVRVAGVKRVQVVGVVAAAVVVLVAGCGGGAQGNGGQGQLGEAAGGGGFNGTDVAWIQLMVAMDEQMVGLAVRVTGRLGDKMGTVRSGHETELKQLKELRKRAGMSEANPHAGHTMPGLVTQEDIAHADDERRVIAKTIEHFEQRILLAQGVGSSGTQMGVKTLATAIERGSIDALASWRALSMEWVPSVHPSKEI